MKKKSIKIIKYRKSIIAIVIKSDYKSDNISFLTPRDLSQQLGYLPHKKGDVITAHFHKRVPRKVIFTLETIIIKKGKVLVNLYTRSKKYISSVELQTGDVILLCSGGHGFNILEDTEMIEIKQGPYLDIDKERFEGIENSISKRIIFPIK